MTITRSVSPAIGKPPRERKTRLLGPLVGYRSVLSSRTKSAILGASTKTTPSIQNISPPVGTQINAADHILFDLIDRHGFKYIAIKTPSSNGSPEVIYDDGVFTSQFTGSTVASVTDGLHFDIVREGGWIVPPNPTIVAINNDGVVL